MWHKQLQHFAPSCSMSRAVSCPCQMQRWHCNVCAKMCPHDNGLTNAIYEPLISHYACKVSGFVTRGSTGVDNSATWRRGEYKRWETRCLVWPNNTIVCGQFQLMSSNCTLSWRMISEEAYSGWLHSNSDDEWWNTNKCGISLSQQKVVLSQTSDCSDTNTNPLANSLLTTSSSLVFMLFIRTYLGRCAGWPLGKAEVSSPLEWHYTYCVAA